jgi:hypothetical protein
MDKKIVALNIMVSILILVVIAMIASDVIAYKLSRTFPATKKKQHQKTINEPLISHTIYPLVDLSQNQSHSAYAIYEKKQTLQARMHLSQTVECYMH